jgi:hypothetical protein
LVSDRDRGHWSSLPPETAWSNPDANPSDEEALGVGEPVRVVGLGAICDLHKTSENGRSVSFGVSEFALLDDGRRLRLHNDRGFTIGWGSSVSSTSEVWKSEVKDSIIQDVLNVVLPDDDESGEDHPWEWLAGLAQARGINVTADDLRGLPYQVILTNRVNQLLSSA